MSYSGTPPPRAIRSPSCARTPRPYLFIECDADRTVAPHRALELHAAAPSSELWVAEGCGHVQAFVKHPDEYERRVLAFLEASMR